MKKKITVFILACFLITIVTSCFNNNGSREITYVPDDACFFESTNLILCDEYFYDNQYTSCRVMPVYYNQDSFFLEICLDDEVYLKEYDYSGLLLSQMNLNCLSSGQNYDMDIQLFGDDNNTYLIVSECDYGNSESINTLYYLDESDDFYSIGQIMIPNENSIIGFTGASVVEGKIFAQYQYLDNSLYRSGIAVINIDGECLYYNHMDGNIFQFNGDNGDITISIVQDSGDFVFYNFNINEFSFERLNFEEDVYSIFQYGIIGSNGNIYVQKGTHIIELDLESNELIDYMDYNYCDAGLYTLSNGFIDYIDNDKLILLDLRAVRNEAVGRCKITILQRAEINPYSGRTIIDVAELWGIDEILSEGVRQYNKGNNEYFAYVNDSYDVNVVEIPQMYSDIVTNDDLTIVINFITNSLMQDIRNGVGPDVVIGLGDVTQMNNDAYLKDLNCFIDGDNGIKREEYFENAFNAFSTWDKQYQLPLTLQISGIMTNNSNAPSNGIGYTYDEYISLVNDSCNGVDVLGRAGLGRNDIFDSIFSMMQDEFISEDYNIDIDNENFIELATYSLENFSEFGDYQNQPSSVMLVQFYDIFYDMVYGYASYQNWDVYGIPSNSGKGPVVTNFNTVAITTCTIDENEAWSLVKSMLSEDVQLAQMLANPINVNAFEQFAEEAIAAANEVRLAQDENARILDYSDIIRYKEMLLKANSSSFVDTQIVSIMDEELQAFYRGDKSIDEVIVVIENRCQTVLDERN